MKNILKNNEKQLIICLFIIIIILVMCLPSLDNSFIKANKLYISEIMASNSYTIQDEDGDYSDYIEIYNGYNNPINLKGYYLSDSEFETNKWEFPNITIETKEYLIIYASGKDKCHEKICHTNFKLSSNGETLTLSDKSNTIINKFTYPSSPNDLAYGFTKRKYAFLNEASPKKENTKQTLKYSKVSNKELYINEYMVKNKRNIYSSEGIYYDWIELYNNSNKDIELKNLYISDDINELNKYKLPDIVVKKKDYIIIYLGEKSKIIDNQIIANFKLSEKDNQLILSNGKKIIDKVEIIFLPDNISYGKKEGKWYYFTSPTPGKSNNTVYFESLGGQNERT